MPGAARTRTDGLTPRERAIAWRHDYHARVGDRIEPWTHGTIVRASDVPTYYEYNLARVEGPDTGLDAEALAAAADPWLEGLGHRRVEIEDLDAGARVRAGFEAMGWVAERLAFLHRDLPGPHVPPPDGIELREGPFEASRPLRAAWQGESIWGDPPEFFHVEEAVAAKRGTRSVVAYAGAEPAGFAAYSVVGASTEVELVFVMPERRGGGLGGAIVSRALAEGHARGAGDAFIEADDEGAAKRLYERLGFTTVWRRHVFTKTGHGFSEKP